MNKKLIYFEDIQVGQKIQLGSISVTKKEIISFAKQYDPQPFHVNEEKAKESLFEGICASGWHTCSLFMKILYDGFLINAASLGSPGMDEIRWLKPLRPGDTMTGVGEVIKKKPSKSKPNIGSLIINYRVFNKRDELIMTLISRAIMQKRQKIK